MTEKRRPPVRTNILSTDADSAAEADRLLAAGQAADSIPLYRELLKKIGPSARTHHNLGTALMKTQAWTEAESEFLSALQLDPNRVESCFSLGLASFELGRYAAAEANYRRALSLDPRHLRSLCNLGVCLER